MSKVPNTEGGGHDVAPDAASTAGERVMRAMKRHRERPKIVRAPAPRLDTKLLLELVGATAGVGAIIAIVGGALLWLRFDALGLPADRAVTLMPREMLVTVGAHALIGPLVAGLVAVIAIWALDDRSELVLGFIAFVVTGMVTFQLIGTTAVWSVLLAALAGAIVGVAVGLLASADFTDVWPRGIGVRNRPLVVTLGIVGVGVAAILSRVHELQALPWGAVAVAALILGLVAIFVSMRRSAPASRAPPPSRKPVLWVVFAVYLVTGAVVALVRTGAEPKMEPIAVLLKDPEQEIAGFYVGESSDTLHVAQLRRGSDPFAVSAEPVEQVVSVARDRVVRKAMRQPAALGLADDGRDQVEVLLEDLVAEQRELTGAPAPPPAAVPTATPVRTFAPLVSLHADEQSGPISADEFLASTRLFWAYGDCRKGARAFGGRLTSQSQWKALGTAGGYTQVARCGQGDTYTSADFTRPHSNKRVFGDGRAELTGGEGFYLDVEEALHKDVYRHELESERKGEQRVLGPVPAYFERHPERGKVRITYWFFYPFSFPTGNNPDIGHEGDWERISVLTERVGQGSWRPESVRYHQHNGAVDVPWAEVRTVPDESGLQTHPRAYVAKGSHATYRRGGKFRQVLRLAGRNILAVNDDARACPDCPLWFTWRHLVDAELEPWYDFGGAWGAVRGTSDFSGPLGPSRAKTVGGKAPSPETSLQRAGDVPVNVTAQSPLP